MVSSGLGYKLVVSGSSLFSMKFSTFSQSGSCSPPLVKELLSTSVPISNKKAYNFFDEFLAALDSWLGHPYRNSDSD